MEEAVFISDGPDADQPQLAIFLAVDLRLPGARRVCVIAEFRNFTSSSCSVVIHFLSSQVVL